MATRILKQILPIRNPISNLPKLTQITSHFSTKTTPIQITLFPGHGIGPEITESVKQVFKAAKVPVKFEEHFTASEIDPKIKSLLTRESLDSVLRNGVCLKGPIDTPVGKEFGRSVNFVFKNELGVHSLVRPFSSVYGYDATKKDMNLVLIRETPKCVIPEAEYEDSDSDSDDNWTYDDDDDSSDEEEFKDAKPVDNRKTHIFEEDFVRERIMQVVEHAFNYAKAHKHEKMHAIHHAKMIKNVDDIFLECCRNVAKNFPEISYKEIDTDNCFMKIVRDPSEFDVLVTSHYHGFPMIDFIEKSFGDTGLLPSCYIAENGVAIAEPVHGTKDDIAGKGEANPTAMLLSSVMMLHHLKLHNKAEYIHNALMKTILEGRYRTPDLGGSSSTTEFTKAVCDNL